MTAEESRAFEFFEDLTIGSGFSISDSDVVKKWNKYRKKQVLSGAGRRTLQSRTSR